MNHQYWTWWRNWAAYKLSFICCVSTIDLKIAHDSTWDVLQGALKSDLNLHDTPKLHQGILVWCRSWSTIWPFRSSLANDLMLSLRQRVWYVVVRDTTPDPSLGSWQDVCSQCLLALSNLCKLSRPRQDRKGIPPAGWNKAGICLNT